MKRITLKGETEKLNRIEKKQKAFDQHLQSQFPPGSHFK